VLANAAERGSWRALSERRKVEARGYNERGVGARGQELSPGVVEVSTSRYRVPPRKPMGSRWHGRTRWRASKG